MNVISRTWWLLLASFGFSMLSGCNGGTAPAIAPLPARSHGILARSINGDDVAALQAGDGRSWMNPLAKSRRLLYVSAVDEGLVNVYDYLDPTKLLGQLKGFKHPMGECTDAMGDVFVTDFWGNDVREYAHGGTKPLATLADSYGQPIGCAIDPTNGNLAVSNYYSAYGGFAGNVAIYSKARGNPKVYSDTPNYFITAPGYDPSGNLFVEGALNSYSGATALSELPHGGSSFRRITLRGATIGFQGVVIWDGQYLAVTDQFAHGRYITGIYRVKISGNVARVVETVLLTDTCNPHGDWNDVADPTIHDGMVIGGNYDCFHRVGYWNYPKGGKPVRTISRQIAPPKSRGEAVSK
jgi:hypothetical protein